ncbi:group 1 truncated hemoglobin [Streptomyces sp. NPDC015220]|uniref:group I truncated hemoglobin n=1 Tax=Streptomyces sp. NPDC015220 TaxID=3364947 RepID=UPI003700079A
MSDTVPTAPSKSPAPTLFEQLGGEPAVSAVVDIFYDRVLGDPDLESYFSGVDVDHLRHHQRRFVAQALGAQRPYSGRSMRKAHEHLSITQEAFGRVVDHLGAALAEVGVDAAAIDAVAEVLLPLKQEIVTA